MKLNYKFLLLVLTLGLTLPAQAQNGQYNFFIGDDAEMMQTTIKGFGSINNTGYMDAQVAFPFNKEKKTGFFATAGLGVYYKKFRFRDNLILTPTANGVTVSEDNPDFYTDGFFSYSKSKLVVFTTTIQPELGFRAGGFAIGVAPRVDFSLGAKHKRKYTENGENLKFKNTGIDAYDVNPIQLGVNVRVGGMKVGVEAAYMFSPFFVSEFSPQVQTVSVGLYRRILLGDD
jgi:hypothetical protein